MGGWCTSYSFLPKLSNGHSNCVWFPDQLDYLIMSLPKSKGLFSLFLPGCPGRQLVTSNSAKSNISARFDSSGVQITVCRSVWGCGLPRRHFMPPRNDMEIWESSAPKSAHPTTIPSVIANQSADWCGNPFSSINSNLAKNWAPFFDGALID